jgi:hypothetical protein
LSAGDRVNGTLDGGKIIASEDCAATLFGYERTAGALERLRMIFTRMSFTYCNSGIRRSGAALGRDRRNKSERCRETGEKHHVECLVEGSEKWLLVGRFHNFQREMGKLLMLIKKKKCIGR